MLRELETAIQTKEQFLAEYTPIRTAVENFLRTGDKIKGQNRVLVALYLWSHAFCDNNLEHYPLGKDRTYWKRETTIPSTHGPSIPVSVETDRILYSHLVGHSDEIDKAMIRVVVGSSPDGRVTYLPPIWAIEQNVFKQTFYSGIPDRLSDVLPHLH